MATLTATGINCSNGTLDGQYTGTTANNTSFPIGSYVGLSPRRSTSSSTISLNNNISVYAYSTVYGNNSGGSALSGTWRNRGPLNDDTCNFFSAWLVQRVA